MDLGVAQLSKGERAIMTIPAHLAYGDKGFPGLIPGKSELIFDIELIEISWLFLYFIIIYIYIM